MSHRDLYNLKTALIIIFSWFCYSRACFVVKILEKSDVIFPFTVAALTLNLYGQYSSKPVTDTVLVSNPKRKAEDFSIIHKKLNATSR